jgi:histidinol-phosphatase (PHP family)
MLADYHTHTVLCKHAKGTAAEYAEEAGRKGLPELCFTDHAPAPDGYDPKNRMVLGEFSAYVKSVAECHDSAGLPVLFGIEADYYEEAGCLEFLGKWLPAQRFDLIVGSIHYIRGWGFDNPAERATWDSVDVAQSWREYFQLVGKLADTRLFDVVAHLDLPKKFGYRPRDKAVKEMVQPALDRIAAAGMGIELNTSGLRRPVKEIYPSPLILELAREREIPICFGSDAHTPQDVGYAFDQALKLAKEAGYRQCLRFRARQKQLVPLP